MGLKIAILTPFAQRCGIASYSRDLCNALAEQGVDVYVVRTPRLGVKTVELLTDVAERVPFKKVDLIHVQHEYGLFQGLEESFYRILKLYEKPIVSTMHAIGNFIIDPIIADNSNLLITHNKFCKKKLGHPSKIIPHGCKPTKCQPSKESKMAYAIPPEVSIVGYCGFISPYKGLDLLIEAMEKVPNAALLVGGGWHAGPDTQYITRLKERSLTSLEGRCQWIGYVPDEMLSTAYGAMDIVCYGSKISTESGALLMALSHGKATIASSIAPFREKEKARALITFKNVKDLRRKIKKLLKDDDARKELEAGARAYAEENSWESVAKLHIAEYERVLEKSKV